MIRVEVLTIVLLCCRLQKDDACMAVYEDVWYRARVTHVKDDDHVDVLFVDYGNSELVPVDDLRPVCRELMELPMQAFHCRLSGIQPLAEGDWDEASSNRFHELVLLEEAKSFQLCSPTVLNDKDGVKFVEGHLVDGETDIASLLVEGGYAQSCCDSMKTPAESGRGETAESLSDGNSPM